MIILHAISCAGRPFLINPCFKHSTCVCVHVWTKDAVWANISALNMDLSTALALDHMPHVIKTVSDRRTLWRNRAARAPLLPLRYHVMKSSTVARPRSQGGQAPHVGVTRRTGGTEESD